MGSSQFGTKIQAFNNTSHWEQFTPARTLHQLKQINYVSFRNKINGLLIDRYQVEFKNEEEERIYKYHLTRRSSNKNIVEVLHYCQKTEPELCRASHKADVYIQHMPIRLANLKEIPFSDAIYVFSSALSGLAILYDQKGYFELKQNHLCFNSYGELKVWINSDLSKDCAEEVGPNWVERTQCSMVLQLTSIITKKLAKGLQEVSFENEVLAKKQKLVNFEQAKRSLTSYCNQIKLTIPSKCQSLVTGFLTKHRQKTKSRPHKTNLSGIKSKIMGCQAKNQRTESKAKFTRRAQKPLSQTIQPLNYSIDQSRIINVLWQSTQQKGRATHKPYTPTPTSLFERKVTLADELLSQSSFTHYTRSKPTTPSAPIHSPSNPILHHPNQPPQKLQIPVSKPKASQNESPVTASSTPRGYNYVKQKCKYSTKDLSFEIDPDIAEDLAKYL